MKINWGTAIVISFILFGGFIGYLAYTIQTHSDYNYELVHENYYQQELSYNENRIAQTNATQWANALQIEKEKETLKLFYLPPSQRIAIKGYCPVNSKKDFLIESKTDSMGILRLSNHYFVKGNWTLTLHWSEQEEAFQLEKKYYY